MKTNFILNKELDSGFFMKSFEVSNNVELVFVVTAVRQKGLCEIRTLVYQGGSCQLNADVLFFCKYKLQN